MYTQQELDYITLVEFHCGIKKSKLEILEAKLNMLVSDLVEHRFGFFYKRHNILKSIILTISKRKIQCKLARINLKIKTFFLMV